MGLIEREEEAILPKKKRRKKMNANINALANILANEIQVAGPPTRRYLLTLVAWRCRGTWIPNAREVHSQFGATSQT